MKTITFILTSLMTLNLYSQTENNLEKERIYNIIKTIDDWYKKGYVGYEDYTEAWYIDGENSSELKKIYSKENYTKYVVDRIKNIDTLNLFTDTYYQTLLKRLDRNDEFNEAMILTCHRFGNMIKSFLVQKAWMDGISAFWPEENIFEESNKNMSDSDYVEWHKERINIDNTNSAVYKIFYGEIGFSQGTAEGGHGDYHLFKIVFLKEDGQWKIDNMFIEEQTKEDAIKFYDENVERRGYFKD